MLLHYVVDMLAIEDGVLDHDQEVVGSKIWQKFKHDLVRNVMRRRSQNHSIRNKFTQPFE